MCSLGDDADASSTFIPKEDVPIGTICIKCRENTSVIVLRNKDAYCKECFLKGTVHKFRSLLGKHKLLKPNDKVLIIYDGSESATAMLHFIRFGLNLTNQKCLKFEPFVIFIEPDISSLSLLIRKEKFDELTKAVAKHGFILYFTSYADYLDNFLSVRIFQKYTDYLARCEIPRNRTKRFENRVNLSDYNLLSQHTAREFYIELAKKLYCRFCFTCELAADVAAKVIANVAFGRGGLLPMDVGTYDDRDCHVKIVRPMRQLNFQEVQFYNILNDLKAVDLKMFQPNDTSSFDSIQSLVHDFVRGLQSSYSATVSTIVRTADKLGIAESASKENVCKVCKCPIEINLGTLSSDESTEFSCIASTNSDISVENNTFLPDSQINYCFSCRKFSENIFN